MDFKYELNSKISDAVYTEPIVEKDKDNIFITALPEKLNDDEISEYYYTRFDSPISKDASAYVQEEEINLIDDVRFPLRPVYLVETKFRSILCNSYRKRYGTLVEQDKEISVADSWTTQGSSMEMPVGSDGNTGFAFLGVGGSGKSSCWERLLPRYPKVIVHHQDGSQIVQIVWIYVQPDSDFGLRGFLDSIAKEIDSSLMNSNEPYYNKVRSMRSIGEKANYIAELFRLFNVGVLVIDEIQRFNTAKNKADSYESIMTIINKSKVALSVCGTEEAYHKFFYRYYIARRIGEPIRASQYCSDYNYFCDLVDSVMEINWFKYPYYPDVSETQLSQYKESVYRQLFEETGGIIERIITIWKAIQIQYIYLSDDMKKKFILSPEIIKTVSRKSSPLMSLYARQTIESDILSAFECAEVVKAGKVESETSQKDSALNAKGRTDDFYKTLNKCSNPIHAQKLFDYIENYLKIGGEVYADRDIIDEIVHVMAMKSYMDKPDDKIAMKVIKMLHKHPEKQMMLRNMTIRDESNKKIQDFTHFTDSVLS